MSDLPPSATPAVVGWLGYGGLLPFMSLAALACFDHERAAFWHAALRAYGAVILSFVGALHWGFATVVGGLTESRRHATFIWSVIPCLIAFLALVVHLLVGDILLLGGFFLQYWRDRRLSVLVPLPDWYLPLRLRLTIVASMCTASAALFAR